MTNHYPNRRSIRLRPYDYAQSGLYFITICTHDRKPLFGEVCDNLMIVNPYGQAAYDCWRETERVRRHIRLGEFVVMPNHFHAVFAIDDASTIHEDGWRTAGECDAAHTRHTLRSPSQTVGAIVRGYKSAVTNRIRQLGFADCVWQRNYHEHIIRNERELHFISQYIIENPARWQGDCYR